MSKLNLIIKNHNDLVSKKNNIIIFEDVSQAGNSTGFYTMDCLFDFNRRTLEYDKNYIVSDVQFICDDIYEKVNMYKYIDKVDVVLNGMLSNNTEFSVINYTIDGVRIRNDFLKKYPQLYDLECRTDKVSILERRLSKRNNELKLLKVENEHIKKNSSSVELKLREMISERDKVIENKSSVIESQKTNIRELKELVDFKERMVNQEKDTFNDEISGIYSDIDSLFWSSSVLAIIGVVLSAVLLFALKFYALSVVLCILIVLIVIFSVRKVQNINKCLNRR